MKKYFLLMIVLLAAPLVVGAATGTIDSANKYAWATNAGWINFGCASCNVQITDSAVTGYAWNKNYGWINLSPAIGGVKNDGAGNLSGSAWGANTGWINFNNVTINSQGQFTGTATGDVIGTINFACGQTGCPVTTTWTPPAIQPVVTGGGGAATPGLNSPAGGFKAVINNGAAKTNNSAVTISLDGGPDATQVEISSFPNLYGSSLEAYETTKSFVLPAGDGTKTIYVRFFNKYGGFSQIISSSIILDTKPPILEVGGLQNSYAPGANIIISGKSDPNSQIIFSWADQYGMITADNWGNWNADFGKFSAGNYTLLITAKNSIGNIATKTIVISVKNEASQPTQGILSPIINGIKNGVISLLPKTNPAKVAIISKKIPLVFSGKWNLLLVKAQNGKNI